MPDDTAKLYVEARNALRGDAPTACVLTCRKILHHVAVEERGREKGKFGSFKEAIEYLNDNGYLPPGGKPWVDFIRDRANEANHEIVLIKPAEASGLLYLTEHLLRHVYELKTRVPPLPPKPGGST